MMKKADPIFRNRKEEGHMSSMGCLPTFLMVLAVIALVALAVVVII